MGMEAPVAEQARPNVLWIQCDEIRADALSCYHDNPWLRPDTPNVERLAGRGVVFANAFCPSPVCMPSRGCELTSQHATTLGVYHNVTKRLRETLRPDLAWPTWPRALRDHGYRAVNVGKRHEVGYDVWDENVGCRQFPPPRPLIEARREELDLAVVPGIGLIVGGTYPLDGGGLEGWMTRQLTRLALARLDELDAAGQPWLLRVSYVMPHTPVLAPPPFDARHPESAVGLDPVRDRAHDGMSAYERSVAAVQRSAEATPHEVARARATYYGLVAALDREFALLLDRIPDATIVLLTGDHGTMLGEQGLWQKQVFNRKAHQVPFILAAPGLRPGRRSGNVDLLDTGPTVLGLCGVPAPEGFVGRDLFAGEPRPKDLFGAFGYGDQGAYLYEALFRGPHCPRRLCIRSGPYRLDLSIRRDGRPLEANDQDPFFCDTRSDPAERRNAAADPAHAATVRDLRARLLSWHHRTTRGARAEP